MTSPDPVQPPSSQDDLTILDDARLWRRVIARWIVRDTLTGAQRMGSGGFSDSSDGSGMSAHLVSPGDHIDRFLVELQERPCPYDGVAELRAGDVRAKGYGIVRVPEPWDSNHVEITGGVRRKDKQRKQSWLSEIAVPLRYPTDPPNPALTA